MSDPKNIFLRFEVLYPSIFTLLHRAESTFAETACQVTCPEKSGNSEQVGDHVQ